MSSVPHVASADSLKEQWYSLTRFWNPSTDNWEGANFTLLSGLSAFSWCFLPPQLIRWSHPESFSLVTPLGQTDVLAVPQSLPRSFMNREFINSLALTNIIRYIQVFLFGTRSHLLWKISSKIIHISRLEIWNVLSVAQHSHHSGLREGRCCWNAGQSTKSAPHHFVIVLHVKVKAKNPLWSAQNDMWFVN